MLSYVGHPGKIEQRHRSLQVTAQTDQIVGEGDVPRIADQRLPRRVGRPAHLPRGIEHAPGCGDT
jgi:hypothetical protein